MRKSRTGPLELSIPSGFFRVARLEIRLRTTAARSDPAQRDFKIRS